MNYDKILEEVLFANSKEEIDKILRNAINKLQETCVEISDEEKTEFVLKLIDLRKRLGFTKEVTTVMGIRVLVHKLLDNKELLKGKTVCADSLYGVFSSENQFFIAENKKVAFSDEYQLRNYHSLKMLACDSGLINYEGVWSDLNKKFDEKYYVVKLSRIIGTDIAFPTTKLLDELLTYINQYLLGDPNFVKNAFGEEGGKLLIKHIDEF